jgi:hypothetical protein
MVQPGGTGFTVELEPTKARRRRSRAVRRIERSPKCQRKQHGITAQPTRDYVSGTIYIRMANGMTDHLGIARSSAASASSR